MWIVNIDIYSAEDLPLVLVFANNSTISPQVLGFFHLYLYLCNFKNLKHLLSIFHCPIQAIHRHWPLFAGFDKAPEQLLPVDGFPAPILLYYPELRSFDLLVGRIAIRAIEAFASSSNRRPVLGHPGIDNFVFVGTALNTPH